MIYAGYIIVYALACTWTGPTIHKNDIVCPPATLTAGLKQLRGKYGRRKPTEALHFRSRT